jgi:arginine repressor
MVDRQACYTVKELTVRLCASGVQVTERTVQRWLRARGVRAERMGNAWVYWEADLKDRCASAMASMGMLLDD